MSDNGALDIILLALVAGFILLRLRSVLGRRTGHERPPAAPAERSVPAADNVTQFPPRDGVPAARGSAAAGIARIKLADSGFDENEFAGGAKAAYEMVVTAFAQGDMETLRQMVAPDVTTGFAQAIAERNRAKRKQETRVERIRSAEIVEADLRGNMAEVTVKLTSDLINVVRDDEGKVVEGNPNASEEVIDVWTFSRDTRSGDPNWTLIATDAPAA
jgi:predicted lipid-binding transport protein (Tim44 family)